MGIWERDYMRRPQGRSSAGQTAEEKVESFFAALRARKGRLTLYIIGIILVIFAIAYFAGRSS